MKNVQGVTSRGMLDDMLFSILLLKSVKRFRRGLVFKADRLLYPSTLGSIVIKTKRRLGFSWLHAAVHDREGHTPISSDTMHSLISFRKSTPPQNRQVNISKGKQQVDNLVRELTF